MTTPSRSPRGDTATLILAALAADGGPLSVSRLVTLTGGRPSTVAVACLRLVMDGHVEREMNRGHYRYRVTERSTVRIRPERLPAFLDVSIARATCTSPNGRTDGHGAYVRKPYGGEPVCAFCGEPVTDPAPSTTRG